MRKRLTAVFVLLGIAFCAIAFLVRTYSLEGSLRRDESEEVQQVATAVGAAVRIRIEEGAPVDEAFLQGLVGRNRRLMVRLSDPERVRVVAGPDFTGSLVPGSQQDIYAAQQVPGGVVVVSQEADVLDRLLGAHRWGILLSLLLLAMAAGVIGYLFARALARPFLQLASAASALGRGRFDLDLPSTRVPEAQQIGDALRTSAQALQVRIEREQTFAQHASHLLRTPLTAMRLELDDLALDDGLASEARRTIQRCVQRIDELDAVAGELVGLARGTNGPGVEVPLHELATGCAQRWADELAHHDRTLTAAVEGDLETTYTPGPLEHIHELLLVDVLQRSRGPVRLVYESIDSGALRLRISATEQAHTRNRRKDPASAMVRAHAVVTALGGRIEGEYHERGLDIMLPRR